MNQFAAYRNSQLIKSRRRAAETRAEKAKNKALAERNFLYREWKRWHKEQMDELLAGERAAPAQELAAFLENMTPEDSDALLDLIERQRWHLTDEDTKYRVLRMISTTIIYLRELEGLAPFDDPLPFGDNEETSLFFMIREAVNDRASPRP